MEALSRIEETDPDDPDIDSDPVGCRLRADGIVLLKHVACFANAAARDFGGMTEKHPGSGVYISIKEIGNILRSTGFQTKRMKQGNVVLVETAHLEKMRARYGLVETRE